MVMGGAVVAADCFVGDDGETPDCLNIVLWGKIKLVVRFDFNQYSSFLFCKHYSIPIFLFLTAPPPHSLLNS